MLSSADKSNNLMNLNDDDDLNGDVRGDENNYSSIKIKNVLPPIVPKHHTMRNLAVMNIED